MKKVIKIGVTGGIGSGKSYVCRLLAERGIPIYNCDNEAKRLMAENESIRKSLSEVIGDKAYIESEGTYILNKPIIASFLFADEQNASKVNAIVHPVVKQDFCNWAMHQTSDMVVQECAILFESGFNDTVDVAIEVYAAKKLRLQRAMARDNASAQQIEARMTHQMPEEEKRRLADFTIVNDTQSDLNTQIDNILDEIRESY